MTRIVVDTNPRDRGRDYEKEQFEPEALRDGRAESLCLHLAIM
jgi:hypothetical protein